ncbi:MAG TPA: type II secretion system protein [bacterium]|nr:type II secretion system protein [bacterium]HPV65752.1 type II secretion system protein [bacterium]
MNSKKAFTLLEVLLTVSILVLSAGVMSPIYFSAKNKEDLSSSVDMVVASLRRAQALSIGGQHDTSWGVKVLNGNIIVFSGNDFLSRNSAFDEKILTNKNIIISGNNEFVFDKITGSTSDFGSVILSLRLNSNTISVNKRGIVSH